MTAIRQTPDFTIIRPMLEQQRAALLDRLHHDIRETRAETVRPEDAHDLLDVSAAMAESDIRVSLINSRAQTLAAIDAALSRLEEGCYGLCESCGKPIAEARLHMVPFALRCTRCQEAKEAADRGRRKGPGLIRRLEDQRRASLNAGAEAAQILR